MRQEVFESNISAVGHMRYEHGRTSGMRCKSRLFAKDSDEIS